MKSSPNRPPAIIGDRYRLVKKLGEGAYGVVYEAVDTEVGTSVAIKLIQADALPNEAAKIRLTREIEHAYQVESDYVAKLEGLLITDEHIALILELVRGKTLYRYLRSGIVFSAREAVGFGRQIAAGLMDIHAHDIVHRDLKLENIALKDDSIIKILDFGASIVSHNLSTETPLDRLPTLEEFKTLRATTQGQVVGSLQYMCPHYLNTGEFDKRADIYGLGIILYELISGQFPFAFESANDLVAKKLRGDFTPLSEVCEHCPQNIERIISKCLQRDPEQRPCTVKEVQEVLSFENQRLPIKARDHNPNPSDLGRKAAHYQSPGSKLLAYLAQTPLKSLEKLGIIALPVKVLTNFLARSIDIVLGGSIVRAITVFAFVIFVGCIGMFGNFEESFYERFVKPISDSYTVKRFQRMMKKPRYITPTSQKSNTPVIRDQRE